MNDLMQKDLLSVVERDFAHGMSTSTYMDEGMGWKIVCASESNPLTDVEYQNSFWAYSKKLKHPTQL